MESTCSCACNALFHKLDATIDREHTVFRDHKHADLDRGFLRLANETAEMQVMFQDQITALRERNADLETKLAEAMNLSAQMGERIDEELKAIHSAIRGHERQIQRTLPCD